MSTATKRIAALVLAALATYATVTKGQTCRQAVEAEDTGPPLTVVRCNGLGWGEVEVEVVYPPTPEQPYWTLVLPDGRELDTDFRCVVHRD